MKFKPHMERRRNMSHSDRKYTISHAKKYRYNPKNDVLDILGQHGYFRKTYTRQQLEYIYRAAIRWYCNHVLEDTSKETYERMSGSKHRFRILGEWYLHHNLSPSIVFPCIQAVNRKNRICVMVYAIFPFDAFLPHKIDNLIKRKTVHNDLTDMLYNSKPRLKTKYKQKYIYRLAHILQKEGYHIDWARVEQKHTILTPWLSDRFYLDWKELRETGGYKEGDILERIDLSWQRGLLGSFIVTKKYATKKGHIRYILQSIRYGTVYRHPFTERELCMHGYSLIGKTNMEHLALLTDYWQDPERINYLPPEEYFIPTKRGKPSKVKKRLAFQKKLNAENLANIEDWVV